MKGQRFPQRIFLDPAARFYALAQWIVARAERHGIPLEVASKTEAIRAALLEKDPLGFGKKCLYLGVHNGDFLKSCPGTSRYICCGYRVVNLANNCPIDCSYCVLQNYLNNPLTVLYVNLNRLFLELREKLHGPGFCRIGTGELADSLALEDAAPVARDLISFFAGMENVVFELKTKTAAVEGFLDTPHGGRTIVAWSLNPPRIIEAEEKGSASLSERLRAARRCQERGFLLAFHFDPIVRFPGWDEAYLRVVDTLFQSVDPSRVAWISLGCLRFPPSLKRIMAERFPENPLSLGEFIHGLDGKMRYVKTFRMRAYSTLASAIRKRAEEVLVYLCMESAEVWKASLGYVPRGGASLCARLDARARHFVQE